MLDLEAQTRLESKISATTHLLLSLTARQGLLAAWQWGQARRVRYCTLGRSPVVLQLVRAFGTTPPASTNLHRLRARLLTPQAGSFHGVRHGSIASAGLQKRGNVCERHGRESLTNLEAVDATSRVCIGQAALSRPGNLPQRGGVGRSRALRHLRVTRPTSPT